MEIIEEKQKSDNVRDKNKEVGDIIDSLKSEILGENNYYFTIENFKISNDRKPTAGELVFNYVVNGGLKKFQEKHCGNIDGKEIKIVPFKDFCDLQINIIKSDVNIYYAGEKIGHSPDIEEAAEHFIKNGGAEDFRRMMRIFLKD